MVFRDVDTSLAKQGSYAADHAWNVVVGKDQQCIPGLDIDVESADSREARRCTRLRSSGNNDFLHAAAQPDFNRIRIVLDSGLRCRKFYPAGFGDCTGIDQIEPFLFDGTFQQATCSGDK
jgi:hypothetical protein